MTTETRIANGQRPGTNEGDHMTIAEMKPTANDTAKGTTDTATDVGNEIADQTRSTAGQIRDAVGGAMDRVPDVKEAARSGMDMVAERIPVVVEGTRVGAQRTTTSLQTMPDTTLRMLAGVSIGLAAGLSLAGAPRLMALMAFVPALFVGGAVATRPETDRRSS
jgi:hypothetical protein